MGAYVFATDVLKSNINKIKKFRKIYKFKNLKIFQHDYTRKLRSKKKFKLISCHNWIQHTPNPSKTLFNIIQNLENGGRIYISCYHANTFRFFITQISRKILDSSHFKLLKKRVHKVFKKGFKIYRNPDNIFLSNITDDFFTPYLVTTTYSDVLKLAKKLRLKAYTKIPRIKNIEALDNLPLRVGLKKIGKVKRLMANKYFNKSIDGNILPTSGANIVYAPGKAREDYFDIKQSRSTNGNKSFNLEVPYIQSHDAAEDLMAWLVDKIMKPRKSVGLQIFSMPTIQLGDLVSIDYTNPNGVDEISSQDSQFVVYHIEYERSEGGPSMKLYLSEVN